jgi:predicted amidohydrolase YtcJ
MSRLTLFVLLLAACRSPSPSAPNPTQGGSAIVLRGGAIWTGDPAKPTAEAIALVDDRIVAVGTTAEVEAAARAAGGIARTIELGGRRVVPGFIDAHIHIMGGGLSLDRLDLNGLKTRAEILGAVAAYAKAHPDRPWILGRGWGYQAFAPDMPTRQELDKVVPDRPVWLRSYDGHTGWANSKALALAGVDDKTVDPADGKVVREAGSKRPAGALLEGAMSLVGAKVPSATAEEKRAAVKRAVAHAAENGLTTLCEVGGALEDLAVYEALAKDGELPLRVVYGPSIDDGIAEYEPAFTRLSRAPSSRLLPGPLKGFVDGVIESNTAGLLAPPADGSGESSGLMIQPADLLVQMREADSRGMDLAYHAIGDRSVRAVLDAVAALHKEGKGKDRRFRVEHIEVIDASDLPRFKELGVTASMMPIHAEPGDEPNGGVWSKKVGPKRLPLSFAFRSITDAGAPLAFGSDWPVMTLAPLPGLGVATTRQSQGGVPPGGWVPEQRISVDEALHHYTAGSARALRLEEVTGVLRPGLQADLAVLSGVDFAKPLTFHDGKVDLTIAAGRIVFERK